MRGDELQAICGADLAVVRGGHGPTTEQIDAKLTALADSLTRSASQIDKKTQSSSQTLGMLSMLGR